MKTQVLMFAASAVLSTMAATTTVSTSEELVTALRSYTAGDTIRLTAGTTYDVSAAVDPGDGSYHFIFSQNLTIDTTDPTSWRTTADTNTTTKINIATNKRCFGRTGGTITVKNITFVSSGKSSVESQICNNANVTFTNCVFRSIQTTAAPGVSSWSRFRDCNFYSCSCGNYGGCGNYTYNYGCRFEKCGATGLGGVLVNPYAADDCEFIGCYASGSGIICGNMGGTISVNRCVFTNCTSKNGCIANVDKERFNVYNCRFVGNSANTSGACVKGRVEETVVSGCYFKGNYATPNYVGIVSTAKTVTNCTFDGNGSDSAVAAGAVVSCSNVVDCVFSNNFAKTSGAAAHQCVLVTNCQFVANRIAAYSSATDGGVLSSCSMVVDCLVSNNTSTASAAGLKSCPLVRNCAVVNNSGTYYGMGCYCCARVEGCTIAGNTAGGVGAAASDCEMITNCVLYANHANGSGSAGNSCGFCDCVITNHSCGTSDGSLLKSCGNVRRCKIAGNSMGAQYNNMMSNSKFYDCDFSGGVCFGNGSWIERCELHDLTDSGSHYGAILAPAGGEKVTTMRNCLIRDFNVNKLIFSNGGDATMQNCTVVHGAFRAGQMLTTQKSGDYNTNTLVFENCLFHDFSENNGATSNRIDIVSNVGSTAATYVRNCFCRSFNLGTPGPTVQTKEISNCVTGSTLDPRFCGAGNRWDAPVYQLMRTSPAKNKGLLLDWMTSGATDLALKDRVFDVVPDIGCYECDLLPSGTAIVVR